MKLINWLKKWKLESLKINTKYLEASFIFSSKDKIAAWEMYVELITRSTTQNLPPDQGDEKRALESIKEIFALSRETIKRNGPNCINFTKIAIVILNQVIRPFTTKWHSIVETDAFSKKEKRSEFRKELSDLQVIMRNYTRMLSAMSGVEDITDVEEL